MKLLTIVAAVIVGVSGCATPADLRTRVPVLELTSQQSAKAVAVCITDSWENSGAFGSTLPINIRPTMQGYNVSFRPEDFGHTSLMVDVDEFGTGSRTRYYKYFDFSGEFFDRAVKECQEPRPTASAS